MKKFQSLFILLIAVVTASCNASDTDLNKSFDAFWSDFSALVAESNFAELRKVIGDPLEVRGGLDYDPVILYPKNEQIAVLEQVFAQMVAIPPYYEEVTLAEAVSRLGSEDADIANANNRSFYSLRFEFRNDRWMLIRAYLTDSF